MTSLNGFGIRVVCCVLLISLPVQGAGWETCDGKPVKRADYPLHYRINSCSISDLGSPEGTSVVNAYLEVRNYVFTSGIALNPGDPCVMDHDNGENDVGLVDPGEIDGADGLTITKYDGCSFLDTEEHITEADVMVSVQLLFDDPDQSFVVTTSKGTEIGRAAMLHEFGHSVGLDHSSEFAIMRPGTAKRVPFIGHNASGTSVHFTGDDVLGIRTVYGLPIDYPNLFATAMWLDKSNGTNLVRTTDVDPSSDKSLPNIVNICPGQNVSFFASVGSQSIFSRSAQGRIYADVFGDCSTGEGAGTELARFSVTVNPFSIFTFPVTVTVPTTLQRNTWLRLYTTVDPDEVLGWDRRRWDNCARTPITLNVGTVASCGK
jgi:hypothetical protein